MVETRTYPVERLHEFVRRVFVYFGVPEVDGGRAADVLTTADLRAIDSHGVARLHSYFEMLSLGRINPKPNVRIVRETASTATVDGDNGLGLVAPLWGAERMLGTNPLAIAFPGKEEPPIVIDLATCAAAYGKVEMALRLQKPIPEGWAIDAYGRPTTDPKAMIEGGAILPLGSERERGGHKGYALAMMVDVLSAVLSGANWGPFTPPFTLRLEIPKRSVGKGIGHFFGALRIDGFIDPDEFKCQIDDLIRTFRATKPAPGTSGPLIPGDPEREAETIRRQEGIPLVLPVVEDLRSIANQTGIPFD